MQRGLRFRADSNRCKRFCRPLPSHSATKPCGCENKAKPLSPQKTEHEVANKLYIDVLTQYFMMHLQESEFILNSRGAVYHLNLLPEELATTVITVGDPDRVGQVSKFFD